MINLIGIWSIVSIVSGILLHKIYFPKDRNFVKGIDYSIMVTILILIFFIGALLRYALSTYMEIIPISLLFTLFSMLGTIILGYLMLDKSKATDLREKYSYRWTLLILIFLIFGAAFSMFFTIIINYDIFLYILLFLIGYEIDLKINEIKKYAKDIALSIIASFGGIIFALPLIFIFNLDLKPSLMVLTSLGWYTFSGPFLGITYGPLYGSLGFLVNILREQFTIIFSTFISRFGKYALIGCGGATAMDTTLPFIKLQLGPESAIVSFGSGVIITLLVPVILPLIFYF